jgi:transcriptional regulator with XRE-family HTH domain
MILRGFNQQKLARLSGVSDSEVSRILGGKSQPGLENALKLARAVGVSLDYLADDQIDRDPLRGPETSWHAELQELSRDLGAREAVQLLLVARTLGPAAAMRRLIGLETRGPAGVDASGDPRTE